MFALNHISLNSISCFKIWNKSELSVVQEFMAYNSFLWAVFYFPNLYFNPI